jgi:hypothetical protein
MSVIIVKYTQIECDGCGLQSGPEYGVSEIDVEARALDLWMEVSNSGVSANERGQASLSCMCQGGLSDPILSDHHHSLSGPPEVCIDLDLLRL